MLPVLPQLIMPIKHALNTRDPAVMVRALRVLQALVGLGDGVGQALVPYYRQLLPVMSIFLNKTGARGRAGARDACMHALTCMRALTHTAPAVHLCARARRPRLQCARATRPAESLGDRIDYHQRHGHIGEVIRDTLNKLEARGGPNARINIIYMIPTWGGPKQ